MLAQQSMARVRSCTSKKTGNSGCTGRKRSGRDRILWELRYPFGLGDWM